MLKILFILIFSLVTIHSEASGLRCFDLFATNQANSKKESAQFYAEALDSLNEKYNHFLFKENLADILEPKTQDAPFFERTKARYQAYKLRKTIKALFDFDTYSNRKADIDIYTLEKLAVKIEKLSFLSDESVTEKMTISEKILYRQAQHSLLSQGLAKFLFSNEPLPPPSKLKKIYKLIMTPFKDIYFRWTYALVILPKLNGATIPLEVIEKVVWEGYEQNKSLLEPYLLKTQSKYFFNIFSTSYNWIMAGTILFGVGQFVNSTYYDVYIQGQVKAEQMLSPNLEQSEKMATKDWQQYQQEKRLENFLTEFKLKYQREPTSEEMQMIQKLIAETTLIKN